MDFKQHRRPHSAFWVIAVVVSGTFFISHLAAQVTSSNLTGRVLPPGAAMRCERLRSLPLPNTTILTAEIVPVGTPWEQPGSGPPPNDVAMAKAPASGAPGYFPLERPLLVAAHCRVEAVARPSPDSEIGLELWLPLDGWNGKFLMVGNGGWGGRFLAPSTALNEGYATASTDTGHKGQSGQFALGHPEKLIDFAYRAVHETAVRSKEIVAAFYDRPARLSYFDGCSTGGRQGLMEAQRYPEDFDGIIAAAPAHHMTHLAAWRLGVEANVIKNPAGAIPETKLALVNRAVLAACDGLDGVADEFLTDPRQCRYDPSSLLCGSADADDCLTASQVEALKSGYQSATTGSGEVIFPGLVPGAESRWLMLTGTDPEPGRANDLDLFRYAVHQDSNWDWRGFDIERDTALADQRVGYLNATNPDLSAFKARGGKLIMYHGWNDGGNGGAISPLSSLHYYSSVLATMGPRQDDWFQLYMVPGMAHCLGGPGATQVNWLAAMERWRERGLAPVQLIGARVNMAFNVNLTRPVCPYPQIPTYTGIGTTNDAANFVCRVP